MKKGLLIFIFISLGFSSMAQERFFEFLPGWRNYKIFENAEQFVSVGLISPIIGQNNYQFATLNNVGLITDEWGFDIDTSQNLVSTYTNDISCTDQNCLITGTIKGLDSDRFYGTFIRFNNDFNDTIGYSTFNILPGNGTQLRTHISINSNKYILGVSLQNTEFKIYTSLIHSDSLGNSLWRKDFYCSNNCDLFPYHIQRAADNGYFFTCKESHNLGSGNYSEKTAIIKTDSLGNEQYRLHPGNPDLFTVAGWVLPTDDGNYITAYSDPNTITDNLPQYNANSTIWIQTFDITGDQLDKFNLNPPKDDYGENYQYKINQMIVSENGDIIIVGEAGARFGFILKTGQNGNLIWIRIISPPQAEGNDAGSEWTKILGITPTSDGGYIMAGEYFSSPGNIFPEDIQTAIAVKVDEFGCLEPGCQLADAVSELEKANLGLQVYPNPASEVVNISVAENVKVTRIRVYEVTGRVVIERDLNQSPQPPSPRGNRLSVDVSELVPGMYLIEVETDSGQREVKRVVIEK